MKRFPCGAVLALLVFPVAVHAQDAGQSELRRWQDAVVACDAAGSDPAEVERHCGEMLDIAEAHFADQPEVLVTTYSIIVPLALVDGDHEAVLEYADKVMQLLPQVSSDGAAVFSIAGLAQFLAGMYETDPTARMSRYLEVIRLQHDRGLLDMPVFVTNDDDVEFELPSRERVELPVLTHALALETVAGWMKRDAYYIPSTRQIVFHDASSGLREPVRFRDLADTPMQNLEKISELQIDGEGRWLVRSDGLLMNISGKTASGTLLSETGTSDVGYSGGRAAIENGRIVLTNGGARKVVGRPDGIPANWTLRMIAARSDGIGVSGNAHSPDGRQVRAFEWWQDEGYALMPGEGEMLDTDGDGIRKVGYVRRNGQRYPAAWDGDIELLGDLPGGGREGVATAIDGWGMTIAGWAESARGREAFIRKGSDEPMQGLGDLPGGAFHSEAHFIDDAGNIVFGVSESARGAEVFVWDVAHGMRTLQSVLAAEGAALDGWRLVRVLEVSANDDIIVGEGIRPNGQPAYWMVEGWAYGYRDE